MKLIELIGNTPMVQLSNMNPNIYVKMESKNPGGSIKDRAVLGMILGMEEKGLLQKGDKLIEATSGNTGIALSMIGAVKGYDVTIVMPESMSKERRDLMKAYGAKLILTPAKEGMQGSVDKMNELLATNEYKSLGQFDNPDNPNYHFKTTGPEIFSQVPDVDVFVAGFGTGGTVSGIGRYLKEQNKDIKVIAVEPASSPLVTKGVSGAHKIQGIGANFIPKNLDTKVIDEFSTVEDQDALDMLVRLGKEEGLLVGISSAANVAAAMELSKRFPNAKIVTVANDGIEKYLSMGIF